MRRKDIGGRGPCKPPTQGENLMFKTLRTALFGMGAFLPAGGLLIIPGSGFRLSEQAHQLGQAPGAGRRSDLTRNAGGIRQEETGAARGCGEQDRRRRADRQPLRGQGQARRLHVVPRAGRAEHHHPADCQGRELQLRQLRLHRPHHGRQLRRGREQGRPVEQPQGI